MKDKPKWLQPWTLRALSVLFFACAAIELYAIILSNGVLFNAVMIIAVVASFIFYAASWPQMLKIVNSKAQRVQYIVSLLIVVGFELFFVAHSFNIEPPEWFKYVIVTILLAAAAALLWSVWQLRREQTKL